MNASTPPKPGDQPAGTRPSQDNQTTPPQGGGRRADKQARAERQGAMPMVVKGAKSLQLDEDLGLPERRRRPGDGQEPQPVQPPAPRSRFRRRHLLALLSFLVMAVLPVGLSAWYLWTRAADQYASYVGFSVRTEDSSSALMNSILGQVDLGGQTPDADILYDFIQSQDLVARIDARLDLRTIWTRPGPDIDPVFTFDPSGTIEDLRDHWQRMVHVSYDGGTGLIELRVLAFTPDDARAIAEAIADESTRLINDLSLQAREDAIRYARDELDETVARLKEARGALTAFRNRTQIVDPTIDVQGQAGILQQLNTQLAESLIELDMLHETTRAGDPRIDQAERRIRVIEARIESEKQKLGIGAGNGAEDGAYADLVGEYESLVVDREFAERTYTAAMVAYDSAQAEARRQSRYLAIHLRPTLAERSEFPQRPMLLGLIGLFTFLIWAVVMLVAYSLRDRR